MHTDVAQDDDSLKRLEEVDTLTLAADDPLVEKARRVLPAGMIEWYDDTDTDERGYYLDVVAVAELRTKLRAGCALSAEAAVVLADCGWIFDASGATIVASATSETKVRLTAHASLPSSVLFVPTTHSVLF